MSKRAIWGARDAGLCRAASVLLAAMWLAAAACGGEAPPSPEFTGEGGAGGGGGAGGDGGRADPDDFELGELEVLAEAQPFPVRLAIDGDTLYFSNRGGSTAPSGSVLSVPKAGGALETLADGQGYPAGIAVLDGAVYWANVGVATAPGAVNWLEPGGAVESRSPLERPIDVLPQAGGVYWIELTGSLIWAPSGGAPQTLADDLLAPTRLLDGGDRIFVAEEAPDEPDGGRVRAWSKRDHAEETIATGLAQPQAIALHGGELFVACAGDGTVKAIELAGGSERVLATGQDRPWGLAVDAVSVYFTNRASTLECDNDKGSLNSVPIAGGPMTTLAPGLRCPSSIAVDDTGIYWVTNGSTERVGDGAVLRIPKHLR